MERELLVSVEPGESLLDAGDMAGVADFLANMEDSDDDV
jgi:hypothetical protein